MLIGFREPDLRCSGNIKYQVSGRYNKKNGLFELEKAYMDFGIPYFTLAQIGYNSYRAVQG